jgi:hypothetical protein
MDALLDAHVVAILGYWGVRELLLLPAACRKTKELLSTWQTILWGPWLFPLSVAIDVASPLMDKVPARDASRIGNYAHMRHLVSISDVLRVSSACDDHAIVQLLLQANVDPNAPGPFRCWYPTLPLHAAAKFGRCRSISLLMAAMANVDAKDENGLDAISLANACCQESAVQMLLDYGATLEAFDDTTQTHMVEQSDSGVVSSSTELSSDSVRPSRVLGFLRSLAFA